MRFRPGVQCLRISLGTVVTVIFTAGCAPTPNTQEHTVDYYRTHPKERAAKLAECTRNLGAQGQTPDCINAREATRTESGGSLRDLPPMGLPVPETDPVAPKEQR